MSTPFDILGLGCVAVDDLIYVPHYPAADSKVRVQHRERQPGGITATALAAATRMGARCQYAGALGFDDLSEYSICEMGKAAIGLDHLCRHQDARPYHSAIVVDEQRKTRTIFFDRPALTGAFPNWPAAEVIRSAKALFVDYLGAEGMLRATKIALEAGIPVVGDIEILPDEDSLRTLAGLVNHLIVSSEFAQEWTGAASPSEAVRALWSSQRQTVIVTCGADGCWYLDGTRYSAPVHQPACRVDVVDTTGCGDVFHGAYAAGLAEGLDVTERIRLASAAAALKATRRGGQSGIPSRAEVEAMRP